MLLLNLPYLASAQGDSKKNVIAVIDTGAQTNHPFIKNFIWKNDGESGLDENGLDKSTNGIDDDNNGYIDDIHGWNFLDNDNSLSDKDGHGTHISGIIKNTLKTNNDVSMMILKYHDGSFTKSSKSVGRSFVSCVRYAIDNGATIINISGGGYKPHPMEFALFKEAAKKGIKIIAAAGNKKSRSKNRLFYPAAYPLPNIVSVVAVDSKGKVLPTSNVNTVAKNLYAPGYKVLSALPSGKFGYKTGSSQAAAFITGHIAQQLAP